MSGPHTPRLPEAEAARLYHLLVGELTEYALFLATPDGTITSWHQGVERVLGYAEDEFVGQHASCIFTAQDNVDGVPETEMARARQEGRASDVRWHVRKDGSRFYGTGVVTALTDESGALVGFSKIVHDDTARKRLEEALLASNAALERFAHTISHDLQEPLRTIAGFANLAIRRAGDRLDGQTREHLGVIEGAAQRAGRMVRELLAQSRPDAPVRREPVPLDEALEVALANLRQAVEESSSTVTHDSLPVLVGDPVQFVRLLQNLVANAVKFRRPGGPARVHVGAERRGGEWLFTVRDDGIGFVPGQAKQLFRPFVRLHGEEIEGSGLGLATARRIVEQHGGRIWAESPGEGQGATFSFVLPAADV